MAAASFVTDVLATTGHLKKEDIQTTLGKLSQRIDEVKGDLFSSLQSKYVDFLPQLNAAIEFNSRIDQLSDDIQLLSSKIERETKGQLDFSTAEFEELVEHMTESRLVLRLLQKLMTLDSGLQTIESFLENHDYVAALEELKCVNACLESVVHIREGEISILRRLREECGFCEENLAHSVSQEWSACVKWHLPSESELSSAEVLTQLSLACVNDSSTAFHSALRTMHCLGLLEPKIKILASTFLQRVIEPIVKVPSTKIDVKSGLRNTLLVTYDGRQKATGAVNPEDLFPSFISAIEFLNEHLLSLELSDGPLMPLLSAEIGQQCIDLIVNECLKRSVPTSNADLDAYCPVVELIHSFHASLVQLGFISEDEVSLTTFADSVSTISASKRTQEVLEKARSLMTTRVHNTVKVTNEQPLGASKPLAGLDGSSAKKTKTTEDIALHTGMKLSANTCQLPECLISQNMAELSRLCYETLYEAKSSNTAQAALQLFFAVRFVVDLYCNVFATQRDSELPQRSAVQHNDCMYLAHHALLLGPQFRHLLPLPSHQSNTTLTLLDFVPKLRRLGAQCFLDQMSRQKALLMESLAGTQGFLSVGEESHGQSSRQALLQAMHQLQHLSNVWHGVLPANIFCKSIGALFNAMLAEVLAAIVSLDDISKDDSTQLHALLKLLVEKAPLLYVDVAKAEDTVAGALLLKHVAKWSKLKELEILMNASLVEISDRWAEGKGPLAVEFKAHEVKQLIRALFQNTDRRADILAKIH